MKIFKKSVLTLMLSTGIAFASFGTDYGLPTNIQDGNILHCFNWTIADVKAELPNIAASGFGAVQLSPLQRADGRTGSAWHNLYRPYDLAFKGGLGTESELQALCAEAANYGIKIIVDVVANHVDKTAGYHDTWWDSNGRVRWEGSINYGSRYSITHGQLGDYGDINSESSEVQQRGKAYIQKLHDLGVKGIRWDAAKHIGLPSEGCAFWTAVTSVPGMWHYGEILNDDGTPISEYANYMSVTDNRYSNGAAKDNNGIQNGYGGEWAVNRNIPGSKLVYWGESHDTYANDEWSQNVDQSVIDRAYACVATRNGATALYLSRPNSKGFNNIKVGKGSTAFKSKAISAVNQLRNKAGNAKDYCTSTGNAFSCTREGVGAVIVMKGSGNITIANGGGYCPAGSYTDLVSGGTFTVTSSNISGNVGSSGIAVIIKNGATPPGPGPDPDPDPDDFSSLSAINGVYLKNTSNWSNPTVWAWNEGGSCTSATKWPGDAMTKSGDYWKWEVPGGQSAPTQIIFSDNGNAKTSDLIYVQSGVYDCSGSKLGVATGGNGPTPPDPEGTTIYYDNSVSNWNEVHIHYWSNPQSTWPGVSMTKVKDNVWKYTWTENVSGLNGFLFCNADGSNQTDDYAHAPINGHIYKGSGGKGSVTDEGLYQEDPTPGKPVVTASPASGSTFTDEITVTLSVSPAAVIYYTLNGSAATTSSSKYSSPIKLTQTTTIKTLAVTSEGAQNSQSFIYTKSSNPGPDPNPGNNLITDYYKVNPNGKVGSERTVNMSFNGQQSSTALNNWTESDLIAQGVARDICQAFKGLHERPVIDSYAIYAAYDDQNLYLGVQMVYSVWDAGGEGKQPGESKPYNMDGRLVWAFDLDPAKSFDGYINGNQAIWNDNGKPGIKYGNGVDAMWIGSTKPGVGTPGFFIPTPDGHASYDAAYCKPSTVKYGYQDGLLPSITKIWAQPLVWGATPEPLTGNEGWVDMRSDISDSAHTFYEFTFPLSLLGVTKNYINTYGIGVQYIDVYGSSGIGGTPYDPAFFDHATLPYSADPSSSNEKEDEDLLTYSCARIGKAYSNVQDVMQTTKDSFLVVTGNGSLSVIGAENDNVIVAGIDGNIYYNGKGDTTVNVNNGLYIVNVNGKSKKVIVK